MPPVSGVSGIVQFGRFRVLPHRRQLLADGQPIELGGRAFDVLMALIEARGAVLTKDELMGRVWPGRIVEENSLHAQISTLRKAFAGQRDLIRTVAGRGYQFTGEIHAAAPAATVAAPQRVPTNVPEPVSELIGRAAELREVTELVGAHRLVTLVGAGGIGKTRLGLEAGRQLLPEFSDGVWVAELGPLVDPGLVPITVAAALGVTLAAGAPSPERVAAALGTKQILLVLDNCEHVIEAAADMAAALLRAAPTVVIATSREPLRVDGEAVYRVQPLEVPGEGTEDPDELLRAGAVQLFVARVRAADPHFTPDRRIAALTAAICRGLDGIPLAIELAAARTTALGLEGLAARLDDRLRLLTGGRRTALPRHQTLRATLEWSHELLPAAERVVLRRLAVFAGGFTLEAASTVAAGSDLPAAAVVDALANLVEKSLVSVDAAGPTALYRLLETTRAYALERLTESAESELLARRHAEYCRDLFALAGSEWETRPTAEWLAAYGRELDNVRAALDWAFSPGGDTAVGVALTASAVPLWFQLSLVDECRGRVERALAASEPASGPGARREMQLHAALGWSLMYTRSPARETGSAWRTTLELAERLGDTDYQLRALWGLWASNVNNGKFGTALELARRFCNLAAEAADVAEVLVGVRLVGVCLHVTGAQSVAREHIERMLARYVTPAQRSHLVRFQFDQRVTARSTLVRVLWLQGFADQAMRTVEGNIGEALSMNHTLSLCNALAQAACPVALLAGDLAAAERFSEMLLHRTARHGLDVWNACGRCFKGMLLIQRGDLDRGLALLRAGVEEQREVKFVQYLTTFLGPLAAAFAGTGQVGQGLAAIDEALERSERSEERWNVAELLRIKGELLLLEGAPNAAAAAEDHFLRSLDWARRQGALSWELRGATSLARLWHAHGRTIEARELLAPVYGRFTEGFGTADLQTAKALLDSSRG